MKNGYLTYIEVVISEDQQKDRKKREQVLQ